MGKREIHAARNHNGHPPGQRAAKPRKGMRVRRMRVEQMKSLSPRPGCDSPRGRQIIRPAHRNLKGLNPGFAASRGPLAPRLGGRGLAPRPPAQKPLDQPERLLLAAAPLCSVSICRTLIFIGSFEDSVCQNSVRQDSARQTRAWRDSARAAHIPSSASRLKNRRTQGFSLFSFNSRGCPSATIFFNFLSSMITRSAIA